MRIVVLGAGYAGVTLVRRLERRLPDTVDVVLVNETDHHLVQQELHRVVRRPSLTDDVVIPLEELVDRARVRVARVVDVDPEGRTVELADGGLVEYDIAAVCLGARTAFYDVPGVEEHATPCKSLADAERIRADFLDAVAGEGRVVVGGAGLSGVQVAGELAALAREEDVEATVTLVEQLDAVAPGFPANFQGAVHDELVERGVTVRTGVAVDRATADAVHLADGTELPTDQFVWTGGITGQPPLGGDRPRVKSDLRIADRTFVLGDAARVVDADGEAVPATAQAAIREARVVADNVERLVEHERDSDAVFEPRLRRFDFEPKGWLVSVGDGAVAQVGPAVFTGAAALALKTTVGASYVGSVGSVRNVVDLVYDELGIPIGEDAEDERDAAEEATEPLEIDVEAEAAGEEREEDEAN